MERSRQIECNAIPLGEVDNHLTLQKETRRAEEGSLILSILGGASTMVAKTLFGNSLID